MAVYQQGFNGAFSGKAGSVIGSNWRSIGYVRGLARFKSKSNSPKQAAQRTRFGMAVSFLRPMKSVLNMGFHDKRSPKSTGYNQAMTRFMKNAVVGEYPDFEIDFAQVAVSRGSMERLLGLSVSAAGEGVLHIGWTVLDQGFSDVSHPDDEVIVLLYNRTEDIYTTFRNVQRQDEGLDLTLPAMFVGNEIHVYVFTMDRDGRDASNSQYAGMVVMS